MNAVQNLSQKTAELVDWLRARVAASADLRLDSRDLVAGDVFVACPGGTVDGRDYIARAIEQGAAAVLCEAPAPTDFDADARVLAVADLRAELGALADEWYGRPSAALSVVAVTGTNGKTSCARWVAQALNAAGRPCGTIGTLGAILPDGRSLGGHLTTPDVLTAHRVLAAMRDAGAKVVALEASSIGLDQGRLDGVRIEVAAFTNLTRDHLDYHGSMTKYEQAKARLFQWPGLAAAIINADDAVGARWLQSLPEGLAMGYSQKDTTAAFHVRDLRVTTHGHVFTLVAPGGEAQIVSSLLGEHNVSNLLLVAGVLSRLGWSLGQIAAALAKTRPVEGRLQVVTPLIGAADSSGQGPLVVVDYSHTPDSLARALTALRGVAQARGGELICLFGCGGERDAGKRPVMGGIAAELADRVTVSSDNPRGESPDAIIAQILSGVPSNASLTVQADRAMAIMQTVWAARTEDVILLAGKGHETYQEVAGVKSPFDDREWARLALLLPRVAGLSTDTRRIGANELFLALAGENFDGHDYLTQAQQAGACAAVVAHPVAEVSLPQIVVGDTRLALMRIGAAWRSRFSLPVVGVVGSNGKTTTKEMISAVLAQWQGESGRLATAGNFNNDIGVPLTLLRLRPEHRAAVFELGMNHPGEIAVLAKMAAPSVAVITNAQREHQEFMHSVEAVARENGMVIEALPDDGVAVFPGDDAHCAIWEEQAGARRVLRFGLQAGLDIYAEDIAATAQGSRCRVVTPAGVADLTLPVPGLHNVRNALAAIGAALAAGATLDDAVRALESFSAVAGRMQRHVLADGSTLIDDTYNANPDSVRAAIDVLAQLPAPRALVLGDMGEVGDNGPAMHREVGEYARSMGIDALYTLGEASRESAAAFGEGAQACASVEEILVALRTLRAASVLVKGSRFMRMERVVKQLSTDNNNKMTAGRQGDTHAA
ncbi:bifunctional UDP-N-acetylmuramoyl-L-alanyl-D-glutamate--2,6-diaminopimelate ligase MurE/UDP-N-acetylmuramoyl-tripeptide--D-alanyl-D-alanine ligase MurF [Bordetella sp. 02P26C-1]|uniref:bifunctional UDP-N-acetylmuramoyl-L-alanyl-D-glutamate--2, 6-diaminopimelate ligase MurE/UDP-N-acetylmuramoyl-tripeptide--D-alanyl-D-alanine ligase MurF n=1 Tax=Bordetella sp. 02P26C-1 TaxID=2683195 RepID=UPI0013521AE8|nr:bifunctional UDP-N-acetylmuramoyl-L-alanyl-D-glutamate--2,6-diaminopimelate ligase MurE/UDP-N-acetylmuramoyl-tripeptide--D-alanyl-D-alanine ligase MurF [Bordetella sp. 02P26C-1]MVW80796.1 bifunctional UDP-N-acetylmuramoyl-L-alanyl-D-glutamate--2,6-diaminopimelate ligase MurE/UDP-N-acetylmuramoyl-tripeptide--D-alanyl-D-alanine ligase MurF [Bordetella sp. 02P26C-1]